jgi:CheY-like chemotaxis protein
MTVPLIYNEQLVGTLNVESPYPNFFGPNDLQFTELYSKEIANALHTLELLAAQNNCASWQALDMVNREIVMPVDDVLACSAVLIKRGVDDESQQSLQRIAANARAIRESIHKVASLVTCVDPAVQAQQILIGKRVLVIEQDERTRKSAHMILEKLGAAVDTAGTAVAGIAMLSLAHYDAVFMEVRPIDLGGYDTYCKLREARPGTRIAMTNSFSHDPAHSYVRAKQDGLKFYIYKPFKQEQMVNVLLAPPPGDSVPVPKGSH